MTTVWIIIALVVAVALAVVAIYNGLVRGRNMVNEAWSGIDVQLKRRHDLVPNLVSAVKQYAAHERSIFEEVSEARARSIAVTGDVAAQAKAENMLSGALRSLFAVAEAYPDLKASDNFRQLQENLDKLEEEIQMARRYYNGTAREQNNRVMQFPSNIVAGMFHFAQVVYFELDNPAEKAVPVVGDMLQ
ncbi:MAG: LemA family protein [Desulfovibrio sp.]|nr:LemA family protein [Desulfovibrio sp.]